ncbi:hypothetical protein BH708_00430 [Brachybacterium sp. P6-10-X1]|uniref:MFS transporter n=1 Tax=Brachybacterium sp. P6-10-X1 TaxID=1903186 RepID=UPI000971BD45|nr:MFS transporter [Brachybacterium sp. P6-10-X1]APX31447.1 hypothetical protein BH708_00430 [Brachybacterium sp. P6-10-X1]
MSTATLGRRARIGSRPQMVIGAAGLAALSAAANMASPLYPVYQQIHGMSDSLMTLLYATFALTAMPALLLFGSAADALGRRPVLLAGLVSAFAGTALFALDGAGVGGLLLGRVLLGIGLGLGTGAGIALMVEASPVRRPALGSTLATIAFVAGTGAGPAMAGIVAEHSASRTTTPFLVMLAVLAAVTVGTALLRVHRPAVRQRWRPTWPTVPTSLRPGFAVAAATGFLGWSAVGIFLALVPSIARSALEDPSLALIGLLVGSVLFVSALSQLIAPRFSPPPPPRRPSD